MKTLWAQYSVPVSTALAFVTVVILALTTYRNTEALRSGERQVVISHAIRQATYQLLSALKDMQTGERGYLITGQPKYLVPYDEGVKELSATITQLRDLTSSDPEQSELVSELHELIRKKQRFLEEAIDLRRKSSDSPMGEAVIDLVASEGGEQLMALAREKANRILKREAETLSANEQHSQKLSSASYTAIVVGNAVALTVIVISGVIAYLDRKRRDESEANLLAKESELSAIFNTTTDAILSFDRDFGIRLMNPAAEATLKTTRATSENEHVLLLDYISIGADTSKTLEEFLDSEVQLKRVSGSGRNALGATFPLEGRLAKVEDAGTLFNLLLFQDMTEAYANEFRKRELSAVLERVEDAIVVCDLDEQITSWNKGAELLYGLTAEQALGSSAPALLCGSRAEAWKIGSRKMVTEDHYSTELTLQIPNKGEVQVEQRRSLIRDSSGLPRAQLVMCIDVTEKRREEAMERRSQRLESIGTLAGGVAHDLNNVLTPILMNAKLARRPGADSKRLLDVIVTSAERGGNMIKKLLAFAGGDSVAVQVVDAQEVVHELQEILSHTLPKAIRVETKIAPGGVSAVLADATELSQVIMNLAINARDAMPRGGKIVIDLRDFQIAPDTLQTSAQILPGSYVQLAISDEGEGIPTEIIDRIFDPFFTTKEHGKGTGLGLATSLGIVRSFGGDITVQSAPGRGSKFSVYLPAATRHAQTSGSKGLGFADISSRGETIMVVDDEPFIVDSVRELLELNGYHVIGAVGGLAAVKLCAEYRDKIDLVILDMMMPEVNGNATRLRLREIVPDLKIIFSSGLRRPSTDDSVLIESQGFLTKPYSDTDLLGMVRRVLEQPPVKA